MKPHRIAQFCLKPQNRAETVLVISLTKLLVVIAVLALLATTQLSALTRAKAPVKFTQCQNNCRQIGQATHYFRDPEWTNYPARFYRLRWP